jgi:hypothetical protein
MSKYSVFKNRTEAEKDSNKTQRSLFISESASSTEIYHITEDTYKTAAFVKEHREGMDQSLLFTYADEELPVEAGHYIEIKEKTYLVFMEYRHSAEEFYKKFKLVECNGVIKQEGKDDLPAAYFGSLRSFMSLTGSDTNGINFSESTEKPILLTSDKDFLRKDYRFMFMDDIYKILTSDYKSNPGIAYLSIKEVPYNEVVDNVDSAGNIPKPSQNYSSDSVYAGDELTVNTNSGYFDTDVRVDIINRTSDQVTFKVPYGVDNLIVGTKNELDELATTEYKVVM